MSRYVIGTLGEYAQIKGVSRSTAARFARNDFIPGAKKVGGRWYVPIREKDRVKIGGYRSLKAVNVPNGDALELELLIPSNLDGKGMLPDSVYKQAKTGDPTRRYSYQGIIIVKFKGTDELVRLPLPSIRSSKKLSRSRILEIIHRQVKDNYGTSPFEILRIDVRAFDYEPPKKKLVLKRNKPQKSSKPKILKRKNRR